MRNILLICIVLLFLPGWTSAQEGDANKNLPGWRIPVGQTDISLIRSSRGESTMNNLIGDIMLWRVGVDFAFINFGDIHADFEAGPITDIDLYRLIPFERTLVVIDVTGEFLQKLMEYNISGVRNGMVIAGGKVECDMSRPNFHRLNYFQVGDYPCYPLKEYKIVTTDYLAAGNAGFDLLTGIEPAKVHNTGILLRDAVREYIRQNSPLSAEKIQLGRWERRAAEN